MQQTITTSTVGAARVRTVSSNIVPYETGAGQKNGWYIDLPVGTALNQKAERMIVPPIVDGTSAAFLTIDPTADEAKCEASGKNFITEVNAFTGTARGTGTIDLNGDGVADKVGGSPIVGAELSGDASIKPAILTSVPVNYSQALRPRAGTPPSGTGTGGAGQAPTTDGKCNPGLYVNPVTLKCTALICQEGETVIRTATSALCRVTVFPQTWIQQVR